MAWETRNRKGAYFTMTRRGPRGRRRVYFGQAGSVTAELASTLVEIGRLERGQKSSAWEQEKQRWQTLEETLERFWRAGDLLLRASLLAAGYHDHHGEWRKTRH